MILGFDFVILGFFSSSGGWICSWWRESERESRRQKGEEETEIGEWRDTILVIYLSMQIYYFNVVYRNIKVGLLGEL